MLQHGSYGYSVAGEVEFSYEYEYSWAGASTSTRTWANGSATTRSTTRVAPFHSNPYEYGR
eukprot:scaffold40430_cov26-Prasinocladus_malaysianus.AAC.4